MRYRSSKLVRMNTYQSSAPASPEGRLITDLRQLIDTARQRVEIAVNAELTLLYWQIGQRMFTEVLQGQRAEYGKPVVAGSPRYVIWIGAGR